MFQGCCFLESVISRRFGVSTWTRGCFFDDEAFSFCPGVARHIAMEEAKTVVALDFLGVERKSASERRFCERNAETMALPQQVTTSFPRSLETRSFPPVAMSLRTRENSSMALKRIFDQINSGAESAPQNLSLAGNSRRGEDGKRVAAGTAGNTVFADKKQESSPPARTYDELQETDAALHRATGMRSPCLRSQSQGRILHHQRNFVAWADDDKRMEKNTTSSQIVLGINCPTPSPFSQLHQEPASATNSKPGYQIPERKASPSYRSEGGRPVQMNNVPETSLALRNNHQMPGQPSGVSQHYLESFRKIATEHADPFRKTQTHDPSQTFLGHTFPLSSSIKTAYKNGFPAPSQLPMNGFCPVQASLGSVGDALSPVTPGRQQAAQLTIFYSGTVNVYDNVPADKANAIMLLAGAGNSWSTHGMGTSSAEETSIVSDASPIPSMAFNTYCSTKISGSLPASCVSVMPLSTFSVSSTPAVPSSTSLGNKEKTLPATETKSQAETVPPAKRSHSELPHARKASLSRFLEKRKDRVLSKLDNKMINKEGDVTGSRMEIENPRNHHSRSPSPSPGAARISCCRSASPSPNGGVSEVGKQPPTALSM